MGEVASGGDPAAEKRNRRAALTVTDLCDQYWQAAESGRLLTRRQAPKKPLTLASDKGRLERHIKPLLGRLPVAAVTSRDVEAAMHAIAEGTTAVRAKSVRVRGLAVVTGGKGVATRTMGLLGAVFAYAIKQGMRTDNPVHGIQKFAEGKRERRLSDEEYAALGRALQQAELSVWPPAVAATHFLALTGWRRGEALNLQWVEVDLRRRNAKLQDTKTRVSVRPLSNAACEVLQSVSRTGDVVFPGARATKLPVGRDGTGSAPKAAPIGGFRRLWLRIAKFGGLPSDVTPHVLRHSFASLAGDLGFSEITIAALIGHKGVTVTSRYVHTADAVLLAAADAVADRTVELMGCLISQDESSSIRTKS